MPTLRLLVLTLAALLLCKSPAVAFDLFATHDVTVQFATSDGKPMANAEVNIYAPGDPTHVYKTAKTDKDGKITFGTDRDGMWVAEAKVNGEVARLTIRVGGPGQEGDNAISPYLIVGGLAVLLALAVGYRVLRARTRGPSR
jgi:nickel transport protein